MSSSVTTALLAKSREELLPSGDSTHARSVVDPTATESSSGEAEPDSVRSWRPREDTFPPSWLEPSDPDPVIDARTMATLAERRRIAREIHDGVAQDVASLSYLVDDLSRRDCSARHQPELVQVREELTRIVTELRNCILDLRTGVSADRGLGAVLASSVRATREVSSAEVHIALEESSERLAQPVETELLRIAQEAVANARKHAGAANIWVSCTVHPPFADVRVEDDGIGSAGVREGHFGLDVMHERADRIDAVLTVAERPGGGTSVSVVVSPIEPSRVHLLTGGGHALQRAACR